MLNIIDTSYDDLLKLDFKFSSVKVEEYPDKNYVRLGGCGDLDKYIWTYINIEMTEDNILEFEIEVVNSDEDVPEELKKYAASLIVKSLQKMVDEGK